MTRFVLALALVAALAGAACDDDGKSSGSPLAPSPMELEPDIAATDVAETGDDDGGRSASGSGRYALVVTAKSARSFQVKHDAIGIRRSAMDWTSTQTVSRRQDAKHNGQGVSCINAPDPNNPERFRASCGESQHGTIGVCRTSSGWAYCHRNGNGTWSTSYGSSHRPRPGPLDRSVHWSGYPGGAVPVYWEMSDVEEEVGGYSVGRYDGHGMRNGTFTCASGFTGDVELTGRVMVRRGWQTATADLVCS